MDDGRGCGCGDTYYLRKDLHRDPIDVSCGIGFSAEHAAIAEMLKHRETRIEMVVATREGGHIVPPSGRCGSSC